MIIDVGAGGDWNRLHEQFELSIIKQFNEDACVAAVGEMLMENRGFQISQKEIAKIIGTPSNFELLAIYFNSLNLSDKVWIGGFFDVKYFEKLMETGTWGAVLREPKFRGHAVLVKKLNENNLIEISDPFDQTSYQMKMNEFLKYLSEFICEK